MSNWSSSMCTSWSRASVRWRREESVDVEASHLQLGGSVRRMVSSHSPLVWLSILTTLWSKRSNLSRRASIQLPSGRTPSLCPHTAVFIHPAIRYQHMYCNYSFQICMFITCMYLKPYLIAVWSTFSISADHQSEYNCGRKRVFLSSGWSLRSWCPSCFSMKITVTAKQYNRFCPTKAINIS